MLWYTTNKGEGVYLNPKKIMVVADYHDKSGKLVEDCCYIKLVNGEIVIVKKKPHDVYVDITKYWHDHHHGGHHHHDHYHNYDGGPVTVKGFERKAEYEDRK